MPKIDVIVVGGGIVGLATAHSLLTKNKDLKLLLLEKESKVAQHQTGNNSGVIHSGLYYKPGSLKAINCIKGYHMLLDFADKEEIATDICGKIVVATQKEQIPLLKNLYERGSQNGLTGLKMLYGDDLKAYEPYVNGLEGFFVPQTGIVDYTKVSEVLARKIDELGGRISFDSKVENIHIGSHQVEVVTNKDTYTADLMINCAGLYSDKIALMTEPNLDVRIVPFRGEYYKIKENRKYLVKNLIYPVPDPNFPFLGVHFTRMIDGGIEAGPNAVLAFRKEGYSKSAIHLGELGASLAWPGFQKVAKKYWKTGFGEMYRSFSKSAFTKALQELIPDIKEDDLEPGGAGVRAQACDRNGGLLDDFAIRESAHCIHVINAPSPAATSSLSIGDSIAEMALRRL
jgi:(S)-2-hydroxyglutarate dehydrogenase